MEVRLQKHIADLGIASRRKAEQLIKQGSVKVNGRLVTEMGVKIDPSQDKVEVENLDKSEIVNRKSKIYIALNKPIDYISSASSNQGQSVIELLKKENALGKEKRDIDERVYPVGRLDKDSEGLMLLTNDGELTNLLTHPRYEHEKEYEVVIEKPLTKDAQTVLKRGMLLDGEKVKGIKILKNFNKGKRTIVTVILEEGKNRQIRKMFGRLGYHVIALKRTRIGKLKLGTLPVGKWRFVDKKGVV